MSASLTVPEPVVSRKTDPRLLRLPERFTVVRELGEGGMGLVVEATDRVLGRPVAIKVLVAEGNDATLAARFLREARAAAQLEHPAIVRVFDVQPEAGYIVMELVRGESLSSRLEREGKLSASEVRRIGKALLEALGHAHAAGIVHRDVKPANVLLGDGGEVKLADFGIAMTRESELTAPGTTLGTPAYMAPEQLRGLPLDARADVYAAGATLFKAATGSRLHDDDRVDAASALLAATGDVVLATAIAQAVSERAADRFANGSVFADALGSDPDAELEVLPTAPVPRLPFVDPPAAYPPATASPPALGASAVPSTASASAVPATASASAASASIYAGVRLAPTPRSRASRTGTSVRGWWPLVVVVAVSAAVGVVVAIRLARTAPSVVASGPRRLAVLPFAAAAQRSQTDLPPDGLPNLLTIELGNRKDLAVIGYYRMESNVSGPTAPLADWRAAASRLGADVIVRGELAKAGDHLRVTIVVETVGGHRLDQIEGEGSAQQLPEIVRGAIPRIVKATSGRELAAGAPLTPSFAADRALQRGIAALEREQLETAVEELQVAVREAPDLAVAHYYLALALYWRARPIEPARVQIAKALQFSLDARRRGVLEALRALIEQDYLGGIAVLRPLAESYPDDTDVLYVLFEALWHGGFPADALVVYRRITELAPRFRLALVHALDYYVTHGDGAGMAWALAHSEPAGDAYSPVWEPRVLVARRDYASAIRLLAGSLERAGDAGKVRALEAELVTVYALAGQLDLAIAHATKLAESDATVNADLLLVLATARGDGAERARLRDLAMRHVLTRPMGTERINRWMFLIAGERPIGTPAELADLGAQLRASLIPEFSRTQSLEVAAGLLAEAVGDEARLQELAWSQYPEASQLAVAALARRTGDRDGAARAMRRVVASTTDGRFLIDHWWLLAGDLRALGDHAGVRAACDEVIRPRRWSFAWGAAVGDCLAWTAEAAEALGDADTARATWQQLATLRAAAPPDDALVQRARAGLARRAH